MVLGGGLSFVGKHKEKLLAGKEAASKMIAALMEWPNALPCHPGESNGMTRSNTSKPHYLALLEISMDQHELL